MRKVISGIAVCAMAFSVSAKDVDAEQVVQDSLFDGIYAGLGIGGSFLKTDGVLPVENICKDMGVDAEADRFSGSVVIGGGKVINKVYGGFEVLFDIAKNKDKGWTVEIPASGTTIKDHKCDYQVGMKGIFPQVNLKAGYSFTHDTVVYGKIGCAWSKVSLDYDHKQGDTNSGGVSDPASSDSSSKTKASIVLGVGAEKIFSNKFSTSLEVDYNFGGSYKVTTGTGTGEAAVTKEKKLNMNKGWSIRALAKYNVKI